MIFSIIGFLTLFGIPAAGILFLFSVVLDG